jgi:hypothetical protein
MAPIYECTGIYQKCHDFCTSGGLGDIFEHLRSSHALDFVRRPGAQGSFDSHGHLWYCFQCDGKSCKDHRSFDSDQAMWAHLDACHGGWMAILYKICD